MQTFISSTLATAIKKFKLGEITGIPEKISGGLLHEIWKVITTQGTFAVKILNSDIMKRPEAYGNFVLSEEIASRAATSGVPAIPALKTENNSLIEIEDKYIMIFPWFDGRVLSEDPVEEGRARAIGRILAQIHSLRMEAPAIATYEKMDIDQKHLDVLENEFPGISTEILELKEKYNESRSILNQNSIMSHRDMDQKNVLWNEQGQATIIDWEAGGPVNPTVELLTMALYWGGIVSGRVEKVSFQAVLEGYSELLPVDPTNIEACLYGCSSFIGWLTYNMERREKSNNPEERKLAANEVSKTVAIVHLFHTNTRTYLEWISEILNKKAA